MSQSGYGFIGIKCVECGEPLIRITESVTNDRVFCPDCLASGHYKEVVEQGAGLTKTLIDDKELMDFIQQKWVAHKLGRE